MGMVEGKVLCIAGMHRSGTSVTASWLQACGLFIGDRLLGMASSNPHGHFEDLDFLELHMGQLQAWQLHPSGLLLKEPPPVRFDPEHLARARRLVTGRMAAHGRWGWKEPRTTLFLEQWKELVPGMRVLAVLRDPRLVARSLYTRLARHKWGRTRNPVKRLYWHLDIDRRPGAWLDRFARLHALYDRRVLEFHQEHPGDVLIVDLDDLRRAPGAVLEALNARFDLGLSPVPLARVMDAGLLTDTRDERVLRALPEEVHELHERLRALRFRP